MQDQLSPYVPARFLIRIIDAFGFVSEGVEWRVHCRIIGVLPPFQITWVRRLALRQLLQDLLEGIILAALAVLGALAALLLLLLSDLLKHLQAHACDHAPRASHDAHDTA